MAPPAYVTARVTLMVSDLDASVEFYTKRLGLALVEHAPPYWASVEAPGVKIGLHPRRPDTPAVPKVGGASIGLAVADLPTAIEALRGAGIDFDGPIRKGERIDFHDPDGYPLYLFGMPVASPSGREGGAPNSWTNEGGR